MLLTEAETLARGLMNEHGLNHWTFRFDTARSRFGACWHNRQLISLSKELVQLNDKATVTETILHEIAHALVSSYHGHDSVWKEKALAIGCNGERYYSSDNVVTPPKRFKGTCKNCGREIFKNARREIACGKCCREFNHNVYSSAYTFKWERNTAGN